MKTDFIVVKKNESKKLMKQPGFREYCRLIVGKRGLSEYGEGSFIVPTDWLKHPIGSNNCSYDTVNDYELEKLYLL